jgi:hypothetical protein
VGILRLIHPALNLANPAMRELLKHIGNEYEGVIAADIADGNAKAQKIDRVSRSTSNLVGE